MSGQGLDLILHKEATLFQANPLLFSIPNIGQLFFLSLSDWGIWVDFSRAAGALIASADSGQPRSHALCPPQPRRGARSSDCRFCSSDL